MQHGKEGVGLTNLKVMGAIKGDLDVETVRKARARLNGVSLIAMTRRIFPRWVKGFYPPDALDFRITGLWVSPSRPRNGSAFTVLDIPCSRECSGRLGCYQTTTSIQFAKTEESQTFCSH